MAAIIYIPFLQPLFGTAPLLPLDLLFLLLLAPAALLLEELRKMLTRKLSRASRACLQAPKQRAPLNNALMLLGMRRLSRKGFYVNKEIAHKLLTSMD
jgi:hypothetical protein